MPKRYRDLLQNQHSNLVATIDTDETCLLLYPTDEWETIQRKIEALPSLDPQSRRLQRLLIGHATDLELDSNGRILLPTVLREYALLDKNVILVGQGRKFEVWDEAHWKERSTSWLHPDNPRNEILSDFLRHLSL